MATFGAARAATFSSEEARKVLFPAAKTGVVTFFFQMAATGAARTAKAVTFSSEEDNLLGVGDGGSSLATSEAEASAQS